ncbi:MAG: 3-keto-disaccharide hydrolase [Phycisphaeraceae bacterium]
MKRINALFACFLILASVASASAAEESDGWEVLFDGTSTDAFRGWKSETFPEKGWVIDGDALHIRADSKAGDIVTKKQYASFDLRFEWKVAKGSNSGVIYRCIEHEDVRLSFMSGPEYQILDDDNHRNGKNPKTTAASLYAHYAPNEKKTLMPIGEWNIGRIVVRGSKVEHWLNGAIVVAYDLESESFQRVTQATHYKKWARFAKEKKGHIAFQDHTDDVWFRNIRIKELADTEPEPEATAAATDEEAGDWQVLFDGTSLDRFRAMADREIDKRWVIDDGTLHYTGGRWGGDLVTKQAFGDFDLRWEWKISSAGNSGVKYRVDPSKPEKKMYALGPEYQILDDDRHNDGKHIKHRTGCLYNLFVTNDKKKVNPVGEWNTSRIVSRGDRVEHWLNGEMVLAYEFWSEPFNEAFAKSKYRNMDRFAKPNPGHIVFQEHRDKVWYRNIRIKELETE